MKKFIKPLVLLTILIIQGCSFDLDLGWGNMYGDYQTPIVPLDQIEGVYEGDIKYWINSHEYLPELTKENGYMTSITMIEPGKYIISFDSTFVFQVPDLRFNIGLIQQSNTIVLESGQAYDNWFPIAQNSYAGHFGMDTTYNNTIWYSLSIKKETQDQDSLHMLTFYGSRTMGP